MKCLGRNTTFDGVKSICFHFYCMFIFKFVFLLHIETSHIYRFCLVNYTQTLLRFASRCFIPNNDKKFYF